MDGTCYVYPGMDGMYKLSWTLKSDGMIGAGALAVLARTRTVGHVHMQKRTSSAHGCNASTPCLLYFSTDFNVHNSSSTGMHSTYNYVYPNMDDMYNYVYPSMDGTYNYVCPSMDDMYFVFIPWYGTEGLFSANQRSSSHGYIGQSRAGFILNINPGARYVR